MGPSVCPCLPAVCCSQADSLQGSCFDGPLVNVVAPPWPQEDWFDEPLELPHVWDLLVQPHVRRFHQGLEYLRLHKWRLSGVSFEWRAFREISRASRLWPSGTPMLPCTCPSGPDSPVVVIDGVSIPASRLSLRDPSIFLVFVWSSTCQFLQ